MREKYPFTRNSDPGVKGGGGGSEQTLKGESSSLTLGSDIF